MDHVLGPRTERALAVSESVGNFLVTKRHILQERIEVLPNGVDLDHFRPPTDDEYAEARHAFRLSDQVSVAGAVARLHPIKGLLYLIRATPQIVERHPNFHLLIAGEGPERERLGSEIVKLGVEEYVTFVGFQRDVRRFLSALDLLVMPSLSEGWPSALLEGMAMQRAVVASRVGGMAQLLEDERTALLVPPADSQALAHACTRALSDPALCARLGNAAQHRASELSLKRIAERLTTIYESLVGRRGPFQKG
jgi:glycosyltransferase involved in cell wall biosynthesis